MPTELLHDLLGAADDALRLVSIKACGSNRLLQLDLISLGKGLRGRIPLEQPLRAPVDPLVGALGGQDRGDEELERLLEIQRDTRIGVGLLQDGEELCCGGRGGRVNVALRGFQLDHSVISRAVPVRSNDPMRSVTRPTLWSIR